MVDTKNSKCDVFSCLSCSFTVTGYNDNFRECRQMKWMVCLTLTCVCFVERYIGMLELSCSGANK